MAKAREFDEDTLDRMSAVYWNEFTRWHWRRAMRRGKPGFELVRTIDAEDEEITRLTKHECRDRHSAELWLGTYRKRAAMKAALDAM